MPQRYTLVLKPPKGQPIRDFWPLMPALHRFLFKALEKADIARSTVIHQASRKPFTFTLPAGNGDAQWVTHIGLLQEDLADYFEGSLRNTLGGSMDLRQRVFTPISLEVTRHSYADILNHSYALLTADEYGMEFLTPTAFRQQTESYLFPEPQMLFRSLLERWNHFAPTPLDEGLLDWVRQYLWPARYKLETSSISWSKGHQIGFVGQVRYVLRRATNVPGEVRQSLSALLALAYFSGVGIKTTMGMGEVIVR